MQTKHQGITTLAVLLIILGATIVAGGGYFGWQYYNSKTVTTTPTTALDETASWQEYKNVDYAYTIKYPKNWYFYQKGFAPPPPTGIFLANAPEGTAPTQYASFTINVDSELNTASLDDYGEVASLVSKGDTKTTTTVSGQEARKLVGSDTLATNVSYYVIYKIKMYRLGYQFPKTQADQQAVCEKILKTFKFTGTPTAPDMSAGNIQTGSPTVGDLSALQASVDKGSQPLYLDPLEVARTESIQYGFTASDTFTFKSKEYAENAGTYIATVEATHEGKTYTIQLIQPETQGEKGIWAINSISAK